ncbi:MAG: 3-phosphoshikimate 1-carboxyvinyltransferase [Thermodesulfovibrionales bacterium]
MDRIEISRARVFKGEFAPPPDKSISHRAVMFSSLAKGTSTVRNFLRANDTLSTVDAFRSLGIDIIDEGPTLTINGRGIHGLSEPHDVIDCGNSGTTIRLLSGVLSGNPFFSVLTGDSSLRTRPMGRVIKPLSLMGASIIARDNDRYPPLAIRGGNLRPVTYRMPVASAQVKSSLMLAGLFTEGDTEIIEPIRSRDHSEKMLPAFGAEIVVEGLRIIVRGGRELGALDTYVPGDFSSAAFFIVAALLIPGAEITARNVGLNPTRTGLLEVLKSMGATIEVSNTHDVSGETVGDIYCRGKAALKAVSITGDMVPSLIDEFPILCVAASLAEGTTTVKGAEELRVKESDRIKTMAAELRKMGVEIDEYPDGLSIKGAESLRGAEVESHGDHRIAMSMAIAALAAEGKTVINNASAVAISFPGFFDITGRLSS